MTLLAWALDHVAPLFIVTSPVTSYADQIRSIVTTRSSAGFSLDIPLIMLVASILKLFYWLGAQYDTPLLIQAAIMVLVQLLLLHAALINRPPAHPAAPTLPLAPHSSTPTSTRSFNFWRWPTASPFYSALGIYTLALILLQLLFGASAAYTALQGYVALGIEAFLPVPQILENRRQRSCKGFRLSVLANWLVGDVFKLVYFFGKGGGVPWAFKVCGVVQAGCDAFLGLQFAWYGNGSRDETGSEGMEMWEREGEGGWNA